MAKIQYNIPIYLGPNKIQINNCAEQVCKYAKISESTSQCNEQKENSKNSSLK